jgi:hypothetical protein
MSEPTQQPEAKKEKAQWEIDEENRKERKKAKNLQSKYNTNSI